MVHWRLFNLPFKAVGDYMSEENKDNVPPQEFQDLHFLLSKLSVFQQTIKEGNFSGSKCSVVKDIIDHLKAEYDKCFEQYKTHPWYIEQQRVAAEKEKAE